jgi:hypothetical protein
MVSAFYFGTEEVLFLAPLGLKIQCTENPAHVLVTG